jgi:hypothetical protein
MPAKDKFHEAVKAALIKDGWTITDDPLKVDVGGKSFFVDIGAEKLFAATKDGRKIAIEVKSFAAISLTYEFHAAVGQFINYRLFLKQSEPDRILYLAIPFDVYDGFFQREKFVEMSVEANNIKYIVCNIEKEEVVKWHE